jgi:uncharacterized membrane protein
MKARKGQFTIPNMVGVAVLLFLFAVTFSIQKTIILSAAEGSGLMLTAVLYTIPVIELLVIFSAPFMLAQKKFEKDQARRRGGRRGR